MLKIDRLAVDKVIKGLEMFTATKEVLANYETEKKALTERADFLNSRLTQQQEQHATVLIGREVAKDNPSEYIQLSKQLTEITEDVKILLSLQDELKGEFTTLKEKYMPIIRETYSKDMAKKNTFDVDAAVKSVGAELKQVISDYQSKISNQDGQVMVLINKDFLYDSELMNESWDDPTRRRNVLQFKRIFDFDKGRLFYPKEIKL